MNLYDRDFYAGQSANSRRSADVIAPIVMQLLQPTSIIDIGCGVGTWLAAFHDLGVPTIVGLDGSYVQQSDLQISRDAFISSDLREPITLDRTFDLAVSLEVAEHLPASRSEELVRNLVALAPAVLFSAAIPMQGGTGHINERWQSSWAHAFEANGYRAFDCVRPHVWSDERVEAWYAQNMLLYVDEQRPDLIASLERYTLAPLPLDVVHPRLYQMRMDEAYAHVPRLVRYATELNGMLRGAFKRS
jgi:SAM-dependent methyltransferase